MYATLENNRSLRLAVFFHELQTVIDDSAVRHALLANNLNAAIIQRGFLCQPACDNLIALRADNMICRRPADQNLLGAVLHQLILYRRGDIGRERERAAAGKRTPYRCRQQHRPAGAFALRSRELGDHNKRALDFTPHQPVTAIKTSLHIDALETRSDAVMRHADLGLPMLLF